MQKTTLRARVRVVFCCTEFVFYNGNRREFAKSHYSAQSHALCKVIKMQSTALRARTRVVVLLLKSQLCGRTELVI